MPLLKPGDPLPDVTLFTHDGQEIRLPDYALGKLLVIFFYPRSGTPVCTREADGFRDAFQQFVDTGATVIGISGCSSDRQRRWASDRNLPFLLASDADGRLRRAFGVQRLLGFLPDRVTFVIDRDGIVRHVTRALFSADVHVSQSLAAVRSLAARTTLG